MSNEKAQEVRTLLGNLVLDLLVLRLEGATRLNVDSSIETIYQVSDRLEELGVSRGIPPRQMFVDLLIEKIVKGATPNEEG
jgi:hypothetical protein